MQPHQQVIRYLVPRQEERLQGTVQDPIVAERQLQALLVRHQQERTQLLQEKSNYWPGRDVSQAKLDRLGMGHNPRLWPWPRQSSNKTN